MNHTTATRSWPSWVATVARDAEDSTILCSGAARTIQITDTSSATPTTIGLCIRPEQLLTGDGAATEPVLVTMTPDAPVTVRDFTPADARRVAAALIEAAEQVERTEQRTVTSTTGTAPITITHTEPGEVRVDLEDGSSQVYAVADLLAALGAAS